MMEKSPRLQRMVVTYNERRKKKGQKDKFLILLFNFCQKKVRVTKSQKHFFLKLHCPKTQQNIRQNLSNMYCLFCFGGNRVSRKNVFEIYVLTLIKYVLEIKGLKIAKNTLPKITWQMIH